MLSNVINSLLYLIIISTGCGVYTQNIVPLIIFQLLSVVNVYIAKTANLLF